MDKHNIMFWSYVPREKRTIASGNAKQGEQVYRQVIEYQRITFAAVYHNNKTFVGVSVQDIPSNKDENRENAVVSALIEPKLVYYGKLDKQVFERIAKALCESNADKHALRIASIRTVR